jgi:hypothetical protein
MMQERNRNSMEIPVNLTKQSGQSVFLARFNSALSSLHGHSISHNDSLHDGSKQTIIDGNYSINENDVKLVWRIIRDPNGNVNKIAIQGDDMIGLPEDTRLAIYDIVIDTLSATIVMFGIDTFVGQYILHWPTSSWGILATRIPICTRNS